MTSDVAECGYMAEVKEYDGSGTLILSPKQLKKGMYVSYLDRPWSDTTFPLQGFRIESEAELNKLRDVCDYVFVDARRSVGEDYQSSFDRHEHIYLEAEHALQLDTGPERPPTEDEFPVAKKVYAQLKHALICTYETVTRGKAPELGNLERAARSVIDSVRRNPDALLYFVRTRTDGNYLYRHGVGCAVMLCALGEAMDMPYQSLKTLTVGGAVLDIGKTRVGDALLNRPSALELSAEELQQLRRHVERGTEVISPITSEGSAIAAMVLTHHERHNGRGYPRRLSGEAIPLFGQMAGIVDMFDAMVSERCYGRRATPHEAMRYIVSQRGVEFDSELVESFLGCFGAYPTGTLVELNSGEVGFVIQQNPGARLLPRVYLILSAVKERLNEFRVIDLSAQSELSIRSSLKPGSYGIDY